MTSWPRAVSRTKVLRAVAALLVTVAVVAPAFAGTLAITLVQMSTAVPVGGTAFIEARSAPAAACRISVKYKTTTANARGLGPTVADAAGRVRWSWQVGSKTARGSWPVTVACEKNGDIGTLTVRLEVE